ncbi:MAG TPA: HrpE/YscL family type III secretion apparatus protein [Rhabdochlamydiaceae bacterium]|nr:HrpE/YscL family type III secretion apparatus protein [Rhabdochlamydiaceae bacterium]
MKFFSLIYQGDVHAATDENIIPAEDYSILVDASQILEKVKEDAVKYRKKTEEECEELRQAAKKEGFDEGLVQFNEHLLKFENNLKQMRHELNKLVLPLALKAAKKIVGKELELHPEAIVDIVLQAIAPVTQNKHITIYVNKADKETLEANKPRIKEILEQVETLSIKERHDVSPGGCVIETETGIINAGIENQWRALEAAFERYMKR